MKKITARKYQGDDKYSWAVFVNGVPKVTGLGKSEVKYWKTRLTDEIKLATKIK